MTESVEARLVVAVTWRCPLRCSYCLVPFRDADMSQEVLLRSVDVLCESSKPRLQLHFFGAEPLSAPWGRFKRTVEYAAQRAAGLGKEIQFILTTNGLGLNNRVVRFLREHRFFVEFSMDGDAQGQNANRRFADGSESFARIHPNMKRLIGAGIDCMACVVVSPKTVERLSRNVWFLVKEGFKKMFLMPACGLPWTRGSLMVLEKELGRLAKVCSILTRRGGVDLRNISDWSSPIQINTELTVDVDGSLMWNFMTYLPQSRRQIGSVLGNVNDPSVHIDDLLARRISRDDAIHIFFKDSNFEEVLESNIQAGRAMDSFVRSLRNRR